MGSQERTCEQGSPRSSRCYLVQEWMAEEAGGYTGLEFVGPQEVG